MPLILMVSLMMRQKHKQNYKQRIVVDTNDVLEQAFTSFNYIYNTILVLVNSFASDVHLMESYSTERCLMVRLY